MHLRFTLALAVIAACLLARSQSAPAHAQAAVKIAVDVDSSGNTARALGPLDSCASVPLGGSITVDVVASPPGIPADRGLSGMQFSFFYDPQLLSVTHADTGQMITSAPGSSPVDFTEPPPNTGGEFVVIVGDFGKAGIEPEGSSETGPGVLARLTLMGTAEGKSEVAARSISLVDDASHDLAVLPADPSTVAVGEPCSNGTPVPTEAPQQTPAVGSKAAPPSTPLPTSASMTADAAALPAGGGPPASRSAPRWWTLVAGALVTAAGTVLLTRGGRCE